jgi:cytochrome c
MGRILRVLLVTATLGSAAGPALAGDATKGKAVFQAECSICHAITANTPGIGPSLAGVVGRKAGSLPHYAYSSAMKAAAFQWTPAKLTAYVQAPQKVVPGDKMPYAGLKDPAKVADLVAYLATLK